MAQCHPSDISSYRMEGKVSRIALGLKINSLLVLLHMCCHCGEQVDVKSPHSLSCHRSQGHYPWHASLIVMVKRSMDSADIPSRLEPNGVLRTDGKVQMALVLSDGNAVHHWCWM